MRCERCLGTHLVQRYFVFDFTYFSTLLTVECLERTSKQSFQCYIEGGVHIVEDEGLRTVDCGY